MRSSLLHPLCALVLLLLSPLSGAAQGDAYERALTQAVEEYSHGNFSEAFALFMRAHEMRPSARTHRGLGVTAFESRRYTLALEHLEAALEHPVRPLTDAQRAEVEGVLRRTRGYVAHLRLELTPDDRVTVLIDGKQAEVDARSGTYVLDPGTHDIAISAEGYRGVTRQLRTHSAERLQLRVELEWVGPDGKTVTVADPRGDAGPVADDAGSGPGLGPVLVMAGGGALLAGALVTGLMADDKYAEIEDACPQQLCPPGYPLGDEQDEGETYQLLSNAMLGVGGAAVVGGVLWWLLEPDEGAAVSVAAGCGPGGCLLGLGGEL